ncbi:MAG: glycosyltransferase family 39 protein [Elusimicrobia bacterium]|nr:glycosyltransferase family 39 protein [Elusimicrobiota bacterium]
MRSSRVPALVGASELLLLLLYYKFAQGVWVSPGRWLASFYWIPVSGDFAWGPFVGLWLMNAAAALVFAACLMLAWALGMGILRAIRWREEAADRRLLLALGLGLGSFSLIGFALAATGTLTRGGLLAACAVIFSACLWDERRSGSSASLRFPSWPPASERPNAEFLAVAAVCAAALAFHLAGAFLPPVAFDEMTYQLSVPKLYTLSGGFVYLPFNHLSFLPRNMNMLFAIGLLTGGPVTAKLFSLTCGALACGALYAFGRDFLGRRAALLAAAAFFLTPVVGNQFRLAVVDLGMAFYELTAVFLFLRWREEGDAKALALSSTFWGLALGCKYSALPGFVACGAVFAWTALRRRESLNLRNAAAIAVPAALLWMPWLVKNWWDTGNPVNPILSTVIRSRNFLFAGEYKPLVDYTRGLGIANYFPLSGLNDALALPWRLFSTHNDFNHDLGAIFLLCLPLAALSRGRRMPRALACVAALCFLYWAFWLGSSIRMSRYFVAGIGLTSLLAGWVLEPAFEPRARAWALALPVLVAWTQQAGRMAYIQNVYKQPWGYLTGRCSLRDYVNSALVDSPYDAYDYVNTNAPPAAKILVVDEFRTFYLDRAFLASTPWDHDYWHETVRVSRDCGEAERHLRGMGVGYVVVNDNYIRNAPLAARPDPWSAEETARSRRMLRTCLERLYTSGEGVWVAKIKETS